MIRALPLKANLVDRHFLLMQLGRQAYRLRKSDPNMRRLARDVALQHVREFPDICGPLTRHLGILPRVPSFQNLATLMAEDSDFQGAIDVCEAAIGLGLTDGTAGGFESRIERLKKKMTANPVDRGTDS
jgi:hypothetical protein